VGHKGWVGARLDVEHDDLLRSVFSPARGGRTTAATIADYVRDRASFVRDVARQKRAPGQRVVADAS